MTLLSKLFLPSDRSDITPKFLVTGVKVTPKFLITRVNGARAGKVRFSYPFKEINPVAPTFCRVFVKIA